MKLFLASSLDKVVDLLPLKIPDVQGQKVAFVANASDNETGDIWWIDLDRKAFERIGYEVLDVDLREQTHESFREILEDADILHICGGSVLYIMALIKERGLLVVIREFVHEDKIVYTGTSAGSMIASRDLSLSSVDPEEQAYIGRMVEYSGLGFINFFIVPHCNSADFTEANVEMTKVMSQYNQAALFMYDTQVVWVEDQSIAVLETT